MQETSYDAVLLVSFGGPDGPADVIPFLENVLRGRNVPRERMLEVAEHYQHFGGKSPINDQNRALLAALRDELDRRGPKLPVYWGNRNWHPLLTDTLREMADAGVRRAIAFVTSAYSSYSGCRQYRENIAAACAALGDRAPQVDKLRVFFNHPGFVGPMARNVSRSLDRFAADVRPAVPVLFTAHSIPTSMADGCRYGAQLAEASRLVADMAGVGSWKLVYQSRSG
ncbi:MAG: ferrochelatase, partial [Proteobacteria bacterium]|nr:ferrochelatase [Pseudomonadota bacterium]